MGPTRALAALVLLGACTGATPPAPGPAPAADDVEPATLLLTGHGHRVERIGDTLYSVGGFTRRNADPERETRRTSALLLPGGRWEARARTHRARLRATDACACARARARHRVSVSEENANGVRS